MTPQIPSAWWQERIRILTLASERQEEEIRRLKATVEELGTRRALFNAEMLERLWERVSRLEKQQWIPWWRR